MCFSALCDPCSAGMYKHPEILSFLTRSTPAPGVAGHALLALAPTSKPTARCCPPGAGLLNHYLLPVFLQLHAALISPLRQPTDKACGPTSMACAKRQSPAIYLPVSSWLLPARGSKKLAKLARAWAAHASNAGTPIQRSDYTVEAVSEAPRGPDYNLNIFNDFSFQ